jgi:DNA-binding GntR family transcriptional regulator
MAVASLVQKTGSEVSLKRQVYDQMLNEILQGNYKPDVPFTEKELVEKYKVSKSPIREALIELCTEGVLRSIPRYGNEVIRIADRDIKEAKEYRIILECGGLDRYWDLIKDEDIERILAAQEPGPDEIDVLDHWTRNSRFHLDLVSCYNNSYLCKALESSLRLMTRAYVQFQWDKWRQTKFVGTSRKHRDVLTAIKEGDRSTALTLLRQDIEGFVVD